MLWSWLLLAACAQLRGAGAAAILGRDLESDAGNEELRNANHIFNAIHSSMRQWGSSLNHNGMSFFLAEVPAGTAFYHGTSRSQPIEGMEWLAFEPEHAFQFAGRPGKPPRKPPSERKAGKPCRGSGGRDRSFAPPPADRHHRQPAVGSPGQDRLMPDADRRPPPKGPEDPAPGYLHTYKTKTVLPLLYIDGMSAGKTDKGTLDSQDILLLNAKNESGSGDFFWENERAERLCKMATEHWDGKIKGFIRMETGFEIILCSFADNLDFVHAVRADRFAHGDSSPRYDVDHKHAAQRQESNWIRAIAARYDGIGGRRVTLNYDNFVTAYSYDADLFTHDDSLPRLENVSSAVLDKIRHDVDIMVTNWVPSPGQPTLSSLIDWQSIADMVVERYARELKYLVSGAFSTAEELYDELMDFLRVFIDADARNTTAEVGRCANQFIPNTGERRDTVAVQSIRAVTTKICSTLFTALDGKASLSESTESLESLIEYLSWTEWKKCPPCPLGQICFIPMWPFGAVEDREHPQCRKPSEVYDRHGYWGRGGPGHGHPPPPH
ncbi:hypothetical protein KCU88_g2528, partial [Aureobasidium melanogenum]